MVDRDKLRKMIAETQQMEHPKFSPEQVLPTNLGKMTPSELQRWLKAQKNA